MTANIHRQPTPEPPRHWTPVERPPETPGAHIMTSTGYAVDGHHIRTVPAPSAPRTTPNTPRPSFWVRLTKWRH
jgi:hypothetical protein